MRLYLLLAAVSSWLVSALSQHISTGGPATDIVWLPLDILQSLTSDNVPLLRGNIVSNERIHTDLDTYQGLYHRGDMEISRKPEEIKISPNKNLNKRHWLSHTPTQPEVEKAIHLSYDNNNYHNSTSKKEPAIVKEKVKKTNAIPIEIRNLNLLSGVVAQTSAEHMAWRRGYNIREPRMNKMPVSDVLANKQKNHPVYKSGVKEPATKFINSNHFEALRQHILSAGRTYPIRIYSIRKNFGKALKKNSVTSDSLEEFIPFRFIRNPMYIAFDLKKGPKRKLKYNFWPGKKYPPIIGPMWTPTKQAKNDWNRNKIILKNNPNIR